MTLAVGALLSAMPAAAEVPIKTVVSSKAGEVKQCYKQRLQEVPSLAGRVAVEVSIAAGRVTSAVIVENTTGDSALESCIAGAITLWQFAADAEGDVYLPFALSSSQDAAPVTTSLPMSTEQINSISGCYRHRLDSGARSGGRIAVDVEVADGRVSSAAVTENTTGDTALSDCVIGQVSAWQFSPDLNTAVSLPFFFAAG